ncbi:MAG: NUDIX domain-containing protein [Trueperella sp.]|nr:NUDIX domain-containing protein [Trueperella sp.]
MRKISYVQGAGAIVWRVKKEKLEVLIVHRPKWDDWSFPKGKLKSGETLRAACIRELKEEARVDIALGVPLGWQRYRLRSGAHKRVYYWTATELPAKHPALRSRCRVAAASAAEVDQVRWVSVKKAKKMLTTESDREMLAQVKKMFDAAELATVPLLLARHTRAQKRSAWAKHDGQEQTRPLTETGSRHAEAISEVFTQYGVESVLSSPWQRCVDSVRPYAKKSRLEIKFLPEITEKAHKEQPAQVKKVFSRLVRTGDVPTVVCVHRPTLPTIFTALGKFSTPRLRRQLPAADPWLKTGEILVAHVAHSSGAEPEIVAYERVRLPQTGK